MIAGTAKGALNLIVPLISLVGLCSSAYGLQGDQTQTSSLRYVGHASFVWKTPEGVTIVVDPFENSFWTEWFDEEYPPIAADFVLLTHNHFDHRASHRVKGEPRVVTGSGRIDGRDFTIEGIKGEHAKPDEYGYLNTVFALEIGGVRFVHWGDNGPTISAAARSNLGEVDVLLVPVDDSEHLLTLEQVDSIIGLLEPKVVIPMHYANVGLTSRCSGLRGIDQWISRQRRVRLLGAIEVKVRRSELPAGREVWIMDRFGVSSRSNASNHLLDALPCKLQSPGWWLVILYCTGCFFYAGYEWRIHRQLANRSWIRRFGRAVVWPLAVVGRVVAWRLSRR